MPGVKGLPSKGDVGSVKRCMSHSLISWKVVLQGGIIGGSKGDARRVSL